jgi:PST family polysaccharide transporter
MNARGLITGTAAIAAATLLRIGLQFGLLPILARLLGPEAYGIVALAAPVVFLAMLIGDAGLGATLVRTPDPDGELESTVMWTAVGVGATLGLGLFAAAPLIAAGLTEPPLAPVLRAFAPVLLLSALCIVPGVRLQKQGRFSAFALGDVASTLCGMAVALGGALHGWGAWSLVAQQLTQWGVKFVATALLSRLPFPTRFRPDLLLPHVRFGLALLGSNLIGFAGRSVDALLVGSVIGVKALGIYSMAVQFMRVPDMVLTGPVYTSLFPTIAASVADREKVAAMYVSALRVMTILSAPAMVGLALTGGYAADLFLGPKWVGLPPVLAVLAPAGAVLCLLPINGAVMLGFGRSDVQFRTSSLCTALYLTGVALGLPFGIEGVAIGCASACVLGAVPSFRAVVRILGVRRVGFRAALFPPVGAAIAMGVAVLLTERLTAGRPAAAGFVAAVAAGIVSYAGALWLLAGTQLRQDLAHLRLSFRRGPRRLDPAVGVPLSD